MSYYVPIWKLPEDFSEDLRTGMERFFASVGIEFEFDYGEAVYYSRLDDASAASMWAAVARSFEYGWRAGYRNAVSYEYNGPSQIDYEEEGPVRLFGEIEVDD